MFTFCNTYYISKSAYTTTMLLHHRTAVATFIQFISLSLLGIVNAVDSIITTCHVHGNDCVSNSIVSIIFFIMTALWFAAVWTLGYNAQERRNQRLAYLLIAIELLVVIIAAFNAKHHTNTINLLTSLVDITLAVWVMLLAFRLSRAKGGRIMASASGRARRRLRDNSTKV